MQCRWGRLSWIVVNEALTLRCRAAFAHKLVAVVLLGYIAVAAPVLMVVAGNDGSVVESSLAGCVYLVILSAAIRNTLALRCKLVLDKEGVTFVEAASEMRLAWNDITAVEVGGDARTWVVEVRTATGSHRPGALKCLRWFGQPKSLREAVETLERYREAARA